MSFVKGLQCQECGQEYPQAPLHVCENCFGPLEIQYDYDGIKKSISRDKIAAREHNLWRYRELLPIDGEPRVGLYSGFTPLVRAHRLGEALGVSHRGHWVGLRPARDENRNEVGLEVAIRYGFGQRQGFRNVTYRDGVRDPL